VVVCPGRTITVPFSPLTVPTSLISSESTPDASQLRTTFSPTAARVLLAENFWMLGPVQPTARRKRKLMKKRPKVHLKKRAHRLAALARERMSVE
jgi:hypothetical protein